MNYDTNNKSSEKNNKNQFNWPSCQPSHGLFSPSSVLMTTCQSLTWEHSDPLCNPCWLGSMPHYSAPVYTIIIRQWLGLKWLIKIGRTVIHVWATCWLSCAKIDCCIVWRSWWAVKTRYSFYVARLVLLESNICCVVRPQLTRQDRLSLITC